MINRFVHTLEKLKEADQLIMAEKTGTPEDFSKQLRITEYRLRNLIHILSELKSPVKYNRSGKTYYYTDTNSKTNQIGKFLTD
jgi:hypothetical protein